MLKMSLIILFFLLIGLSGILFKFNKKLKIFLINIGFSVGLALALFWYVLLAPKSVNYKTETKIIPTSIVHTKYKVYVEFEKYDNPLIYTSKKYYDNIDSNTTFILIKKFNYYNNEIHRYIEIKDL